MKSDGFIYAADMTNQLAEELPEQLWDKPLIDELGTIRKLFKHMIRVRGVYSSALKTGKVEFPGHLMPEDASISLELRRSTEELALAFEQTERTEILMYQEYITPDELLHIVIQHEGIHQGQYYIAFQQTGISVPEQWKMDWNM
ncbi:DinB family protein [Salibacterium salarium]|uniref:DinB family protein n=1 Tax=Salibacterium salarium TaxID=284579 RepID=A0A3R9P7M9_9BACI|nr:DinB family protein [Salibacterium salarium]RSL33098.1 DinB family protein [Salibacterium salarium]